MLATLGLVGLLAGQPAVEVRSPYLDAVRRYGAGTERDALALLHSANVRAADQVSDELDARLCASVGARSCRPHHLIAAGPDARARLMAAWRRLYPRAIALHVEALAACDPIADAEAMRVHVRVVVRLVDRVDEIAGEQRDLPPYFTGLAATGRHLLVWTLQYLRFLDGLDAALRAFEPANGGDLDIRLARGALEELRTLPEPVAAAARDREIDAFARDRMVAQAERRALQNAARVYEQVLADHPDCLEAHLRLGRLLLRLDEPERARTHLDRVATLAPDARQGYLAALFLADVHERRGRRADAVAAYRDAQRLWPGAQAAAIGLARLAALDGRAADARAALAALALDRPDGSPVRSDPWVGYVGGQAWRLPTAMAALHVTFEAEP